MNNENPRRSGERPDEKEQGASRGQIVVMFALFASAMFGILGLAIDLGFAFAERRTVQNTADLAAIAGARAVVRYVSSAATTPNVIAAEPDILAVRDGNQMGGALPTINSCKYVSYDLEEFGDCDDTVPLNATGVSVSVSETHDTFFIRIFPWAPAHITTSASTTAYIERTKNAGNDSRFIVCGYLTKTVASLSTTTAPSGTFSILKSDGGELVVDPAAIGKTFRIVDGTSSNIARCNAPAAWSLWKGLTWGQGNQLQGKEVGSYWFVNSGNTLSSNKIVNEVPGIEGCADEAATPYDCIVVIPVACDAHFGCLDPTGTAYANETTGRKIWVAKSLAFRIHACGGTCLNATLLDDYLMSDMTYPGPEDTTPWHRDSGGVVGIKLKE